MTSSLTQTITTNNIVANDAAVGFLGASEKSINLSSLASIWDQGYDLNGVAPDRPTHPFAQNEWVFACVDIIIKTCRSIQIMLSTPGDEIIESGPAYDLLFRNPDLPFSTFLTETVGYFALYRQAYWIYADLDTKKPKQIIVAGPHQCRPVVRRGVLTGYYFYQEGKSPIPLYVEDVHPLIDFNPDSKFHGVGPASAGELSISSSYQAALLNESTLANGGKIGNLITVPGRIDDDERRMLVAQFESRHMGARNAGKTCLMTGGADVKTLAQSMADMQMLPLRQFDASAICSVFGVPDELINLNSEAQYAHGPAQQRFILNTISSILYFICDHISGDILPRFRHRKHLAVKAADSRLYCGRRKTLITSGAYRRCKVNSVQDGRDLFCWPAIDDHPTIEEMNRERAGKVLEFTKAGVPLNALIAGFGLPLEPVAWGDEWWIPMGLVPARFTLEAGVEGLTGPSLPPEEPPEEEEPETPPPPDEEKPEPEKSIAIKAVEKANEQQRLRTWQNWVISWAGIEREYDAAIRKMFLRQKRLLVESLKKAWPAAKAAATKDAADDVVARVQFDLEVENYKLIATNHIYYTKAAELGIRQSLTEIEGIAGEELTRRATETMNVPLVRSREQASNGKIPGIHKNTLEKVRRIVRSGIEKGESITDVTRRISAELNGNLARARTIARHQTSGAVATGRHAGMEAAGGEIHKWLDSHDEHVRKSHQDAGKNYAAGIPMSQPFVVDNEPLLFPCDPMGSAKNTINCRCMEIIIRAGKSSGPFYTYEQMQAKDANHAR